MSALNYIQTKIDQRKSENAFRELKVNDGLIDFCSNDYLGFASEKKIHRVQQELILYGATGSRLISGNHQLTEGVEGMVARYHHAEAGLIFNSGYTANLGFFSCVPQRGDTILYDELIHASIRDGIRLSNANSFSFKHNDINSLEGKLKNAKGNVWVVIESVYSMDGDTALLSEVLATAKKYTAAVIVDEAHAVGLFGEKGEGLVTSLELENEVFARIVTFGKALGCHGAIILGSKLLRDYLINFSRPFIYTTAMSLPNILVIQNAYSFLEEHLDRKQTLLELITYFKSIVSGSQLSLIDSSSAIQCLVISGNDKVKGLAKKVQSFGYDVRAILSPTVPKGEERLRICLHSYNTKEQVSGLLECLGA